VNWHDVSLVVARCSSGPLPIQVVPSTGGPCVTGRASWETLAAASSLRLHEPPPPAPRERPSARIRQALISAAVGKGVDPLFLADLEADVRRRIAARRSA
jgi:hypothetical protein